MGQFAFMDTTELAGLIKSKQASPVEAAKEYLDRIERLNPKLNAFLTLCADEALEEAKQAEEAVMNGGDLPPLHGVPIAVKDLESTKGIRTTRGSLVYQDDVPDEDSIIVERMRKAGAIILGKTNTPEFGASGTTENKLGDHCRNPWNTGRTTGGSSGGSGAALAAGLCPLATGSDGGGSIRIPSGFCGVFGIKATQGRVPSPRESWVLFSSSGPMSRTVRDSALMLNLISGRDRRDSLTMREAPPDFTKAMDADVKGLRVAWSTDLGYANVDGEVASAAKEAAYLFQEFGCTVEDATPKSGSPAEIFDVISSAEDYAYHGEELLRDHADELMDYVREGLEHGRDITGAEYAQAMVALWEFRARMEDFFETYDLLMTPTMAVPAFPVGEQPTVIDGVEVDPAWGYSPFSAAFNMTGNPAATVPSGFSLDGMPIGLQVVGRHGDELSVLRAAAALEQARPWADKIPELADF